MEVHTPCERGLMYVKTQNYRFWGTENSRIADEEPLDPLKATIAWGVFGLYFSKNTAG